MLFHTNIYDIEQYNINIGSGKKVRIVFKTTVKEESYPFVMDYHGPANSKGNLDSFDGVSWSHLSDSDLDCNWHISMVLKP